MSQQPTLIRCIYCREERPSSKEHVLLEGLGGTRTIPWVCGRSGDVEGCNHRLGGEIDQPFLRETPFAIRRLLEPKFESKKEHFVARPDLGGYLDVAGYTLLPQVLRTDRWTLALPNPIPPYVARALSSLPDSIFHAVSATRESEPTRLVIKKGGLKIRATTDDKAIEFESRLRAAAPVLVALLSQPPTPQPAREVTPLLVTMNCEPNAPSRCAAKMVLNLVALHLGPDFALRAEFDGIRNFVTGRDVEPVQTVTGPDGEEGWSMDVRYVANWLRRRPSSLRLPNEAHGILIDAHENTLFGTVFLWGEPRFWVKVATFEHGVQVPRELPALLTPGSEGDQVLTGHLQILWHIDLGGVRSSEAELKKYIESLSDQE